MPIIGKGDIASVLPALEDVIFFASGVSNSRETKVEPFQRELKLLLEQPKDKHLVYFSSLCVYYGKNEYARHKRIMEGAVRNNFTSYTIVRLGNIDWGVNPNTLINYLRNHIGAKVEPVYRHIVTLSEFLYWIKLIKPGIRNEMNIPGTMIYVPTLFKEIHNTQFIW